MPGGQSGISPKEWKRQVEATGELSLICYREEVESVLRTEGMSGLSLLGLQDFPGQGTALIGMMNSHLVPKPYSFADPERFREFFAPQRILVLMPRYTWIQGETIRGEIRIANYGRKTLTGRIRCALAAPLVVRGEKEETGHSGSNGDEGRPPEILPGTTVSVGEFHIPLDEVEQAFAVPEVADGPHRGDTLDGPLLEGRRLFDNVSVYPSVHPVGDQVKGKVYGNECQHE